MPDGRQMDAPVKPTEMEGNCCQINLVEQMKGCCCGGCGCDCCGAGKRTAEVTVAADKLPSLKLSDSAQDRFDKQVEAISKDISDQREAPMSIPGSLKSAVEQLRKSARTHEEFEGSLDKLVGGVNQRLHEAKQAEFLELSSDGTTTHLRLLRHHGWREHQDSMKVHAKHTPFNASQDELHINDALHNTLNKNGHKLDLSDWKNNSNHIEVAIGRAYHEMGDTKAFRSYLDKLKEATGGKIYYQEDHGTFGLGRMNVRVFHDTPWAVDEKIFDRNDSNR